MAKQWIKCLKKKTDCRKMENAAVYDIQNKNRRTTATTTTMKKIWNNDGGLDECTLVVLLFMIVCAREIDENRKQCTTEKWETIF